MSGYEIRFQTKNDLSKDTRAKVSQLLNARLADCVDLYLQAKQAHWNVKGPNFIALHKLFDEVAAGAEGYIDLIAERVIQFGGVADGTVQTAAKNTKLKQYPTTISTGDQHVEAVSDGLAVFGKEVRKAIDICADLSDADTADLFTEISRGIDKHLWFVEAHTQKGL